MEKEISLQTVNERRKEFTNNLEKQLRKLNTDFRLFLHRQANQALVDSLDKIFKELVKDLKNFDKSELACFTSFIRESLALLRNNNIVAKQNNKDESLQEIYTNLAGSSGNFDVDSFTNYFNILRRSIAGSNNPDHDVKVVEGYREIFPDFTKLNTDKVIGENGLFTTFVTNVAKNSNFMSQTISQPLLSNNQFKLS